MPLPWQLHASIYPVVGNLSSLPVLVRMSKIPGQCARLDDADDDEDDEVEGDVKVGQPPEPHILGEHLASCRLIIYMVIFDL